ncbi:MAG TPA: pantetheine-phosphate adenylyltransferase [Gammaproteobacteria bacterium]|nr:pantetheine-phosphate adenylyltransferase [Gammaproteobacteria bacterium]
MNIVVYPGTFDPITFGHMDLVDRASRIFDRVIVAIAVSANKRPCFPIEERVSLAEAALGKHKNVEIYGFESLLLNFMKEHQANIILRGLRAVSDFDYEFQLAGMNRKMDPKVESLFLMPSESFTYVSSRFVREIAEMGGDVNKFVPDVVARALNSKFKEYTSRREV